MRQRDCPFAAFDVKTILSRTREFESLPFLPRPLMADLSHSRKACLAQGLVEDDGGAVGEVECADAVIVRVDEIAADILLKDGLVAVLGMSERFLVGFPSLGVIE